MTGNDESGCSDRLLQCAPITCSNRFASWLGNPRGHAPYLTPTLTLHQLDILTRNLYKLGLTKEHCLLFQGLGGPIWYPIWVSLMTLPDGAMMENGTFRILHAILAIHSYLVRFHDAPA